MNMGVTTYTTSASYWTDAGTTSTVYHAGTTDYGLYTDLMIRYDMEVTGTYYYPSRYWISPSELTHAEKMQRKINEEWAEHCRREERQLIEVAENKAIDLMKYLIGEKEVETYKETGRMWVKGKNGLYLAKRGGGISKVEGNKIIDFCIHIEGKAKCPPTDHAIALKLMLEEDDRKVIKLANRMSTKTVKELPLAACM